MEMLIFVYVFNLIFARGNAVKDHDQRGHAGRGRPHSFASKTLTSVMSGPTLDSINLETHKGKSMECIY